MSEAVYDKKSDFEWGGVRGQSVLFVVAKFSH